MRRFVHIPLACGFVLALAASGLCAQNEPLRASTVIESRSDGTSTPPEESQISEGEGTAPANADEFAEERKVTLTRQVKEAAYSGVDAVVLEIPEVGDGFDEISVDKATELGREILKICPDGSTCRLIVVMAGGTLTRIYSIQRIAQ